MSFEIVFSDYTETSKSANKAGSGGQGKYELLPEGEYLLRAEKGEIRTTKTKGTEVATITFQVVSPVKYERRKIWHDFYFTSQKAAGILAKFLVVSGSPLVAQGKADTDEIMANVAGLEVRAKILVEDTNTGNQRNAIDPWSFSPAGTTPTPVVAQKTTTASKTASAVIDDMFV
jgi:hypothetical protein